MRNIRLCAACQHIDIIIVNHKTNKPSHSILLNCQNISGEAMFQIDCECQLKWGKRGSKNRPTKECNSKWTWIGHTSVTKYLTHICGFFFFFFFEKSSWNSPDDMLFFLSFHISPFSDFVWFLLFMSIVSLFHSFVRSIFVILNRFMEQKWRFIDH